MGQGNSVNYENQETVYRRLYPSPTVLQQPSKRRDRYKVGDYVRLLGNRGVFEKGYEAKWTKEVFEISKVFNTTDGKIILYRVKDLNGDDIHGTFYHQELQKTSRPGRVIEEIVEDNGDKKLVKWLDMPPSKNSYVAKKHLKNFGFKL